MNHLILRPFYSLVVKKMCTYVPLNHNYATVDYSYSNVSTNTYSIIDHVLVSSDLSDVISSYYSICNDVENQSDHSPIVLELNWSGGRIMA